MDDPTNFDDLVASLPQHESSSALLKLRGAFADEGRRRQRNWRLLRSVLTIGMVLGFWAITPIGFGNLDSPLVAVAEAAAQLQMPEIADGELWYVREERTDWVFLADRQVAPPNEVTVTVKTEVDSWIDYDSSSLSRVSESWVESVSPHNQDLFDVIERYDQLALGRVEDELIEVAHPRVHPMWAGGVSAIVAELNDAAGSTANTHLDRLAVLNSAARLIQHHGVDPMKRSLLLLTIAQTPGIDVEVGNGLVSVGFRYLKGSVAQETRYDFDAANGDLVGRSITTLATPDAPSVLLSTSRYETGLTAEPALGS